MQLVARSRLQRFSEFDNHIQVVQLNDQEAGLRGYIAIHNNKLGPAVGGTRMFQYQSDDAALADVLRLSRAMTYKCALANVAHGGGKGVIIGVPTAADRQGVLRAYAAAIDKLQGQFFTGEDVGISEADVQFMLKFSPFFIGKAGFANDPSPFAALSAYYALLAAVTIKFGRSNLKGVRIAIKGLGKVGGELARLLLADGAEVFGADNNEATITRIATALPQLQIVTVQEIHRLAVDVYAPCALGLEFTDATAAEVKAAIICGAANNQLLNDAVGTYLFEKGILYVPDYVANAGGLIDVADELSPGGFNKERVIAGVKKVQTTVSNILNTALQTNTPPHRIADMWAERIFNPHS